MQQELFPSSPTVSIISCSELQMAIFILGDFNHFKLEHLLQGSGQYVNCKERVNKILDKCYGNIKNAFTPKPEPFLANSVHNTIKLIPTFKTMLKQNKTQIKPVWSEDSKEKLKRMFHLH